MSSPEDTRELRPPDNDYYETRLELLSQGDIFNDVPLAYPMPADTIIEDEFGGSRQYLAGPLKYGQALLITPTCNMRSQGLDQGARYSHPVRTLVPVVPLDDEIRHSFGLDPSRFGLLKKYDELMACMYLPAESSLGIAESLALLYMPITLHHDIIVDQRVTQLAMGSAKQLHRKLTWFFTGIRPLRDAFTPPLD